ncbi:dual specificity protein phosphatase MPK-4 [Ischnura elegans]|uniref:dual specificity protein phosphatase MPK-4 n=1 Tax=Ischnura elegans TaxID=197161 RepID=UPI001ED8BA37|nr:dual specificity protein phosphatase MPK-4 [Ischnura elegans]
MDQTKKKERGSSKKKKRPTNLEREDFDAGPTNLDLIEPGLWLGNLTAATDVDALVSNKITHILTVDSCPLPRKITELPGMVTKFIQVTDLPKEDLLSHFEGAYEFIANGMEVGVVLVHCYFGVSRSATIVTAFLMKKHHISYEEAIERVKSCRRFVGPNRGFIAQLCLYEDMGWCIDRDYLGYRLFRLQISADKYQKAKILPQSCSDVVKPDPAKITVRPEPIVYRCKKCRRIVASASDLIPHYKGISLSWQKGKNLLSRCNTITSRSTVNQDATSAAVEEMSLLGCSISKNAVTSLPSSPAVAGYVDSLQQNATSDAAVKMDENPGEELPPLCVETFFVEPMQWMQLQVGQQMSCGKLYCPKCNSKLGSFNWESGCMCPCGAKCAPAFYLVPSKVERSNVVQNVQVTV